MNPSEKVSTNPRVAFALTVIVTGVKTGREAQEAVQMAIQRDDRLSLGGEVRMAK